MELLFFLKDRKLVLSLAAESFRLRHQVLRLAPSTRNAAEDRSRLGRNFKLRLPVSQTQNVFNYIIVPGAESTRKRPKRGKDQGDGSADAHPRTGWRPRADVQPVGRPPPHHEAHRRRERVDGDAPEIAPLLPRDVDDHERLQRADPTIQQMQIRKGITTMPTQSRSSAPS